MRYLQYKNSYPFTDVHGYGGMKKREAGDPCWRITDSVKLFIERELDVSPQRFGAEGMLDGDASIPAKQMFQYTSQLVYHV